MSTKYSNNAIEIDITELVCVICLDAYNENKVSLILACGHSFCSQCLRRLHHNACIQCPEDRRETIIQSVDHLIRNISIMRMSRDDEHRQILHQQKELLENIRAYRASISHLSEIKRKEIELNLQRISLHTSTLEGFYHLSDSLIKKSLDNQFKEINLSELNKLSEFNVQIRLDFEMYTNLREELLRNLIDLADLEQKAQVSIILHELIQIEQEINAQNNQEHKTKIDKQLSESIEIYNFLKEFEEKHFHGVYDLKQKEDIKLNDVIQGLEYDMKFAKFKIGIVGNSGKGKSSLINRARGLSDPLKTYSINEANEYDLAAPTGVGETTKFPVSYSWKSKPTILLKDFPGFGLCKEPIVENYVNKYLLKDNCHVYIILYTERLTSAEVELARLIRTKLKKHVILARNKIDREVFDLKENSPIKNDLILFKDLKMKLSYELNQHEFDAYFDKEFTRGDLKLFLISCKRGYEQKYDMMKFMEEIFKCLPEELSDSSGLAHTNVFLNLSKNEIHRIRMNLEERILGLALVSAATDMLPLAGQIADMTILISECTRYRNYFCLKQDYINELGKKYNISEERVASILKIVAFDAKYLNLKDFVLGLVSAVSIGISVFQAVTSAVSLGINIATFGAGCLVSAAVSGPFSFYLCKSVLKRALEQMEADALKIIEEIHKEIKENN